MYAAARAEGRGAAVVEAVSRQRSAVTMRMEMIGDGVVERCGAVRGGGRGGGVDLQLQEQQEQSGLAFVR